MSEGVVNEAKRFTKRSLKRLRLGMFEIDYEDYDPSYKKDGKYYEEGYKNKLMNGISKEYDMSWGLWWVVKYENGDRVWVMRFRENGKVYSYVPYENGVAVRGGYLLVIGG